MLISQNSKNSRRHLLLDPRNRQKVHRSSQRHLYDKISRRLSPKFRKLNRQSLPTRLDRSAKSCKQRTYPSMPPKKNFVLKSPIWIQEAVSSCKQIKIQMSFKTGKNKLRRSIKQLAIISFTLSMQTGTKILLTKMRPSLTSFSRSTLPLTWLSKKTTTMWVKLHSQSFQQARIKRWRWSSIRTR